MMMRFIFFAWALILGVVSADDAFTYPPAGGVSSDVTWTIGQLVTANWTTTKTFANLYLWPASNADVHSIYIVGQGLTQNDSSLTFNVPDINATLLSVAYHLTLISADPQSGNYVNGGGMDSAQINIRARPSTSSGVATAPTVTVTMAPTNAPQQSGPAPLGLSLGLGLGLGIPLLVLAAAVALLLRKLRSEQARQMRGTEGIERGYSKRAVPQTRLMTELGDQNGRAGSTSKGKTELPGSA